MLTDEQRTALMRIRHVIVHGPVTMMSHAITVGDLLNELAEAERRCAALVEAAGLSQDVAEGRDPVEAMAVLRRSRNADGDEIASLSERLAAAEAALARRDARDPEGVLRTLRHHVAEKWPVPVALAQSAVELIDVLYEERDEAVREAGAFHTPAQAIRALTANVLRERTLAEAAEARCAAARQLVAFADRVGAGVVLVDELRRALADGDATPWPTRDVLAKLAEATRHLLRDHDCDHHGWETWRAALNAADGDAGGAGVARCAHPYRRIHSALICGDCGAEVPPSHILGDPMKGIHGEALEDAILDAAAPERRKECGE